MSTPLNTGPPEGPQPAHARISAIVEQALDAATDAAGPGAQARPDGPDDPPPPDDEACEFAGYDEPPQPPGDGVDPARVKASARLDQNDTDNARRLRIHFGDDLLFVREIGWHVWVGDHWEVEGGQESVEKFAQETARRIKDEVGHLHPRTDEREIIALAEPLLTRSPDDLSADDKRMIALAAEAQARLARWRDGRRKFAISCGNRGRTVAMMSQAIPHCSIPPAALDADPMLFNVRNGTLRFSRRMVVDAECPDPDVERLAPEASVALMAHDRAQRIAKLAPWLYDPAATAPTWRAFLERFVPNRATRRFLQTAAGRALIGGAKTQVMVFLYGDGANGKSLFMEVLARMLAAYAGRLKPESITGLGEQSGDKATPDFARLQGKRFVAIAELPRGAPLREGLVKTMTGSEPMPVRHLNHGFFDLTPEFIPFMSGNELPEIGGLDKGIWRRMKFVHFPVTIPEAEQKPLPEMVEAMLAEASGVLNWLVEGALIFLREGLVDPPEVTELGEEHRSDLDPVGAFARDCLRPQPGARVQARTLYEAFVSYCRANAIREWKEKSFSIAMKRKGFRREDGRIRQWLDVVLHDVPERPDRDPHER